MCKYMRACLSFGLPLPLPLLPSARARALSLTPPPRMRSLTFSLRYCSNYMHQLVKTHPVSNEYVLRKQAARWGRHSNGYIEFALQVRI